MEADEILRLFFFHQAFFRRDVEASVSFGEALGHGTCSVCCRPTHGKEVSKPARNLTQRGC